MFADSPSPEQGMSDVARGGNFSKSYAQSSEMNTLQGKHPFTCNVCQGLKGDIKFNKVESNTSERKLMLVVGFFKMDATTTSHNTRFAATYSGI